jgi:glycosyltransferase involved in cell wall biosynthesis
MKIALICETMSFLSGSPMYFYTTALEMVKQGHSVSLLTNWEGKIYNDKNRFQVKKNLEASGVRCISSSNEKYDLIFLSQPRTARYLKDITAKKIINIIHSEYECENPIFERIDEYVAIRPSIKFHLTKKYNVKSDKIHIIYNGIDRERFSPDKRQNVSNKIILPCTADPLRMDFINHYIDKATEYFPVELYGLKAGAILHKSDYFKHFPPVFDIEDKIKDAYFVAGILLGRVNLEARSMGIPSYIHNPENPEDSYLYFPDEEEFDDMHNIKNVVKKLIKLYE